MNNKSILILFLLGFLAMACTKKVLPKPKAMLRLDYPETATKLLETADFVFEYNEIAQIKPKGNSSITIDYPSLHGSIFITHKSIENNLNSLLSDAQRFSYEHVVKADNIVEQPFMNKEDKVYGMFYEVSGDAASQSQFYVTDSTRNFVTGSLYFYAKPNYDSILPAAVYLQKDIRTIMETLRWKK